MCIEYNGTELWGYLKTETHYLHYLFQPRNIKPKELVSNVYLQNYTFIFGRIVLYYETQEIENLVWKYFQTFACISKLLCSKL